MTVLCAYVPHGVRPQTVAALDEHAPGYRLEGLDAGDEHAYWRLLCAVWADADSDLTIIEQDVVITADTLPSFDTCDSPVCSGLYRGDRNTGEPAFGCSRIRL